MPHRDTLVADGDRLVLYGSDGAIPRVANRPAGADGDREHQEAVARYRGRAST